MKKNDKLYWARIRPSVSEYDVVEVKVRTVEEDWFVGVEKATKQSHFFNMRDLDKIVFYDRNVALDKVLAAEK